MGRNQQRSAESLWRDRLAKYRQSDLTVAEFCRQEGVSNPSFYQWRKRLEQGRTRSKQNRPPSPSDDGQPPFLPVTIPSSAVAEIELPNGVRIRVPATNAEPLRAAILAGNELSQEAP